MPDESIAQIGPRLKAWREKRGLTLTELALATTISKSTLSRLEAGKRAPNLELVIPIARALHLDLDDIVPRTTADPRIPRRVKRIGEASYESLSSHAGPTQTYRVTLPATPVGIMTAPAPQVHEGQEWLYVLSGRLRLVLGEQDIVLAAGEAAEFDTRVPHWMEASGADTVEFLTIFNRDGRRIHLRARATDADGDA